MLQPLLLFGLIASAAPAQPPGGALAGQRPRVIVSSDIGGSDPDDFQSMVHLLLYADVLDIEGLISSPPGKGRAEHILEVIAAYEKDFPNLSRHSPRYPKPDALRALAKQGTVNPAPRAGVSEPTEGSRWIIERAKATDPQGRPLWVLVWGSITDVAQAVHDEPAIRKAIRVHSIGSWNTAQDRASRDYLFREHPDLWWIESDTTFRGMYQGGQQDGDLGNRPFIEQHVKGHGALGALYVRRKADIKMGDTPSVLYLFRGNPDDPTAEHWGGAFVRPEPDKRPTYWHDSHNPALAEGGKPGAKTVNKWRADYLRDWQQRMDRVLSPAR
ncbi:MAG TPA: DUF1593 domain-containing protein [Planctomycetota bacterium]|nr:DUF1593 domain-containing protein [Planctomycetota bacterium]